MRRKFLASAIVVTGLVLAVAGICIGEVDDAPGAMLMGILLLIGAIWVAIRVVRRRWAS
ncbi:MAG TPA: hypothetical protein VIV64_05205 [Gammaproteobacteria bacterium]